MKSFMASPSTIERKWYVVDATGHTLGRLSSEIASILRGKNKPTFTPSLDTGDYVVVVNADKIKVTVIATGFEDHLGKHGVDADLSQVAEGIRQEEAEIQAKAEAEAAALAQDTSMDIFDGTGYNPENDFPIPSFLQEKEIDLE